MAPVISTHAFGSSRKEPTKHRCNDGLLGKAFPTKNAPLPDDSVFLKDFPSSKHRRINLAKPAFGRLGRVSAVDFASGWMISRSFHAGKEAIQVPRTGQDPRMPHVDETRF